MRLGVVRGSSPRGWIAWLVAAIALTGAAGCRTIHATDPAPGVHQPLFDRTAVQRNLVQANQEAADHDGVRGRMADAAVELWRALDRLHQQAPLPPELGRAREQAALSAYLQRLERIARTAPPEDRLARPAPTVTLTVDDFLDVAESAAAAGRHEEALIAADALLAGLEVQGPQATMAAHVRLRRGLWLLALARYDEARAAFEAADAGAEVAAALRDRARRMTEEVDLLLTLPAGPERDALAAAWALLGSGDHVAARAAADALVGGSRDPAIRKAAGFIVQGADRERGALEAAMEQEALADVADGPPYELAEATAVELERRGASARAAVVRDAVHADASERAAQVEAAAEQAWAEVSADSQALVADGDLRGAAALFDRFQGTELEDRARVEATRLTDELVRDERRRAGELFVAAQKEADPGLRAELLEAARTILAGLLADFPDSTYAPRVRDNLAAVQQAIGGPDEGDGRTGEPGDADADPPAPAP